MRIILVTACSLIVCFVIFWTIKFWGRSQTFAVYQHPLYDYAVQLKHPVYFIRPTPLLVERALDSVENLYLDLASTEDGQVVVAKKVWPAKAKPLRFSKYEEIKNDVILLADVKNKLIGKKYIFNLSENAQAGHIIFFDGMKALGFEKGDQFIVTSPYEGIAKALKELAPSLLFGSTQPEILKIAAMKSMGLIEALNLRADFIIHPLKIKNQKFYDEDLIEELRRRHKYFIVGPVSDPELAEAQSLKPWGIIVDK